MVASHAQGKRHIITFLQDIKLLQTAKHHAHHHTDPKNGHYCTVTNLLNPVLDRIRFWDGIDGCWRKPSA